MNESRRKARRKGHRPPKLGDCEFSRDGDRWKLERNGKLVVTGLTLQQTLSIIRGELGIDGVIEVDNVKLSVPKKE